MSHTEVPPPLLPLDKTSYSTMSNPEVNVILLTSKLNWGQGRLTLFLSSAGTSCPTLLKQLCIRIWGVPRFDRLHRTGENKAACSSKYCMGFVLLDFSFSSWISDFTFPLSREHTITRHFYCCSYYNFFLIYWFATMPQICGKVPQPLEHKIKFSNVIQTISPKQHNETRKHISSNLLKLL